MISFLTNIFAVAAGTCTKGQFFGLVPWYQYLNFNADCNIIGKNGKSFVFLGAGSDLPLVLLAVVDDLIRVAGMVAVIFVIVGGVQYATSQGNPEATSKAQKTIINALVGLVIAIIAVAAVSFIGTRISA